MTQPETFSADTHSLEAKYTPVGQGAAPKTGEINVHASSSLMTNYDSTKAHEFGSQVVAIEDKNGDPMIFAIDQNGHLCVILREHGGKTGFKLVDFTLSLTGSGSNGPSVATLNAKVLDDDHNFMLAFSLVKNGAATLYTTEINIADPQATYWDHPETMWTERPPTDTLKSIDLIDMEQSFDGDDLVLFVAAGKDAGLDDRYIVDTGKTKDSWSKATLVLDGTVKGFALGTVKGSVGCYTLLIQAEQAVLNFAKYDSDSKNFDTTMTSNFQNVPGDVKSMAAVRMNQYGDTDIYLIGKKLSLLSHANQAQGGNAPIRDIPLGSVTDVTADDTIKIVAHFNGDAAPGDNDTNLAIGFLKDGTISLMRGRYVDSSGTYQFATALPIRKGATALAALCPSGRKNVEFFDIVNGSDMSYFYSAPVSTIWKEVPIHFPDPETATAYTTYTTCVHFTDKDDNPVQLDGVEVSASDWGFMTINGLKHTVAPDISAKVSTDNHGSITFTTITKTASTPVFTLLAPADNAQNRKALDINPYCLLHRNLKNYTTEDNVKNGQTQDGNSILGNDSTLKPDHAASAFKQLTGVGDNQQGLTVRDSSAGRNNGLKPSQNFAGTVLAFRNLRSESAEFLGGDDAAAFAEQLMSLAAPASEISSIGSSALGEAFGDVCNALKNELDKIADGAITALADGFKFVISIAGQGFHFILTTVEELAHVVQFVFDEIKMGIEKLIEWLGMLFKWKDILTCQKIIANVVEQGINFGKTEANSLSEYMVHAATQHAGSDAPDLADHGKANPNAARKETTDKPTDGGKQAHNFNKSAGGHFAHYHLTHTSTKGFESHPAFAKTAFSAQSEATAFLTVLTKVEGELKDIVTKSETPLGDLFSVFQGSGSTQQIAEDLFGLLKTVGAETAQVFGDAMKEAGDVCGKAGEWLKASPTIPFIGGFFRLITGGESLNVLNAFSLLLAVPSITLVKLMKGGSPFESGTLGLDTNDNLFKSLLGYSSSQAYFPRADAGVSSFAELGDAEADAIKLYHEIGGAAAIFAYQIVTDIRLSSDDPNEAEKAIMLAGNICILFGTFPASAKPLPGQPVSYMLWGGGYVMVLMGVLSMVNSELKEAMVSIKVVWAIFAGAMTVVAFIANKDTANSVGWLAEKMVSSLLGHVGTLGELLKKFQEAPPPLKTAGEACAYIGFIGKGLGDVAQYAAYINGDT